MHVSAIQQTFKFFNRVPNNEFIEKDLRLTSVDFFFRILTVLGKIEGCIAM